jgi:CheY-like chemotaxis protein
MRSNQKALLLAVGGDDASRGATTRALRQAEELEITGAETGGEALQLIEDLRPTLVLINVNTRDIDGLELCRVAKRDYPEMLVMLHSLAPVASADRAHGLDAGADSYLAHSCEPSELVASVRALLRMRKAETTLRELNETLEQRVAAELARRLEAASAVGQLQKMDAVDRLAGGVAHDFNNMMAVVVSSLNLLERRLAKGDTDVAKYIDGAIDSAKRASALSRRLLAFARQQSPAPEARDVNQVLDEGAPRPPLGET